MNAIEDPRVAKARRIAGVRRDEYPVAILVTAGERWWVDLKGGFSDPVDLTVSSDGVVHWF